MKIAVGACALIVVASLLTFGPLGATIACAVCSALLLVALTLSERSHDDGASWGPCTSRLEVVERASGAQNTVPSSQRRAS